MPDKSLCRRWVKLCAWISWQPHMVSSWERDFKTQVNPLKDNERLINYLAQDFQESGKYIMFIIPRSVSLKTISTRSKQLSDRINRSASCCQMKRCAPRRTVSRRFSPKNRNLITNFQLQRNRVHYPFKKYF